MPTDEFKGYVSKSTQRREIAAEYMKVGGDSVELNGEVYLVNEEILVLHKRDIGFGVSNRKIVEKERILKDFVNAGGITINTKEARTITKIQKDLEELIG